MALGVSPRPSTGDLGGGLSSSFEFGLTALIVSPSQEHETACVSDVNRASFRRSSRKRSLQLSTKPFYLGSMPLSLTLLRSAQERHREQFDAFSLTTM